MEKYNLKNFLELSSKKKKVSHHDGDRHETFDLSSSSAFACDRSVSRLRRQNTSRNYTRVDVGGGSKGDKVQTGTLDKSFDITALIFEFVRHIAHIGSMTSQV